MDDIIIVTKGPKEQHKKELTEVLTRLENAGYRLSENKSEFFKSEVKWIGHKIDQNGIRPLQDKLMAIKNLKQPNNEKELKSFLGAIQYLSKYIDNLSAQTDSLRQLLKKDKDWLWTEEHTQAFENLKQKITEIPCLARYISVYPNIITTDASTKGLGAALWHEQPVGKLKPIGFASRFHSDTEKKYAINELELLAVVWGLEHLRLYIDGKPIKLLTDHQSLEPLIKRNRSNKTYSARLTRWLDRLAHFTINVNHIAGKHLALTEYLSRNPSMPPQTDEAYDEEYVINSIMPHYKFISKHGCLSNHANQSERETVESEHKANNKPRPQDTHKQTAIDCLNNSTLTRLTSIDNTSNFKMDVKTLDNLAAVDFSAETNQLIQRWKEIVKPGIYRMTGGKWKKYHEPKFLRNERKVIDERLQQIINAREQGDLRQRIGPQYSGGYQPNSGRSEQWTVDPFWEMDRPTPVNHANQPGPSPQQELFAPMPMEEGEIESETDQDPSVLEIPAINWARYVGVKSVQYVKMGHAPKVAAMEENNWDLGQAVRETERNFSTDLQLLMNETTNDPTLLKTLVCLERQQHEQIPDEYLPHKKKLSTRFGLVFIEDKIIVPKNLRTTIISLLHKGHPAINKMTAAARHFYWPKMTEAIQKKCESCIPCKMSGKNIKPNIPNTEKKLPSPVRQSKRRIPTGFHRSNHGRQPSISHFIVHGPVQQMASGKLLHIYRRRNGN